MNVFLSNYYLKCHQLPCNVYEQSSYRMHAGHLLPLCDLSHHHVIRQTWHVWLTWTAAYWLEVRVSRVQNCQILQLDHEAF